MLLGPAVFFCSTLLALNIIGDALRDAFDLQSGD
jgi:ABC-type dipeptide/oligopeptide/nickel transport system permease subunit